MSGAAPVVPGTDTTLAGRSAVVTGASRGIGEAIARALAGAGAEVILVARGADALRRVATSIGARAHPLPCDLADAAQAERLVAAVHERMAGTPDLLVSNAGIFRVAPAHELGLRDFAESVQANLVGPFALLRGVLAGMRARGSGHVITIGSVADRAAFPGNAAYAATKYAARALHEVVRGELRGSGVRASLVSPGPVDTTIWDPVLAESRAGYPARDAMLDAGAVADAVLWVATRPATVNIDELRLSRS
ncbi:MAG: SDR family oxidoreductase [Gemmatimonadetes bacterium]|nr:SDR family oxidoreductase [Gemmatimonadota bacterium]